MKVLIASTSKLALPTIALLEASQHEILGIITKPGKPAGRGQEKKDQEIVVELGDRYPIFEVTTHASLEEVLRQVTADLVIAISFGMLIKSKELEIPRFGWINLHFSLLPKYRGASPVQRALLAGDQSGGVTVFALDEGMDTGPIYSMRELSIAGMNSESALSSLAQVGAPAVLEALEAIESGVSPRAQIGNASLAPKIDPVETRIAFTSDVQVIERQIRAFSPKPGAWCTYRDNRLKLLVAQIASLEPGEQGEILSVSPLVVSAFGGALRIDSLQESGKRIMNSDEWVRGSRIKIGDRFE